MTVLTPDLAPGAECSAQPSSRTSCALSVIIVNWNARHVLLDCLDSVRRELSGMAAEIIVIDNGSTDESVSAIRSSHPDVTLIANVTNLGFAAANNQGMRVARGRHVLLLNPDTIVHRGGIRDALAYLAEHPEIGVLGCQVLDSPTTVQRTCFRTPSPFHMLLWVTGLAGRWPTSWWAGHAAYGPWDRCSARPVDVVSGMYMLVRREALDAVGPMDDSYFVFAEEADWCFRFWQAGWPCVFAPCARIEHVDGGSKSTEQARVRMYVQMQKNLLRFHRKNLGLRAWLVTRLLFLISMPLRVIYWFIAGAIGVGAIAHAKRRDACAATMYHWCGVEPDS